MNRMHQALFTINSFSAGILLPLLTLVLLERGANLQTLPLLMAVYSTIVLLMELPSGILADMFGRKAVFLVSCGFQLVSLILMLVSRNFIWLTASIVFFGMARAFSSGSLDAIIIDQALESGSTNSLPRITSRLAVLESAGLAAGSVAGGFTASFFGTYNSSVILRMILTVIVLVLCTAFIKELPRLREPNGKAHETSLSDVLRQGRQLISEHHELGCILAGVFFIGFLLFTIEAYWQPAFTSMPNMTGNTWQLGLITFAGFFSVTAGSILAKKLLSSLSDGWWNIFIISRGIMAAVIPVFALSKGPAGFIACYAGIYLLLGTGNVSESSLINKYTPNDIRASMLSLNSLISQIGGLCSSLFSSIMVIRLQFSGVWIVAGALMACYTVFLIVFPRFAKTRSDNASYVSEQVLQTGDNKEPLCK